MGNDVEIREEDMKSLVHSQVWNNRRQFDTLLPASVDVDVFAGSAAAALYKNPKLAAAAMRQPETLLNALRDCARLGHHPGTDDYALTVRGGGVLGIEQYQGVIHRMYAAGVVKAVHAEVVTKDEKLIRRDPEPPIHEVADWLDRDVSVGNLKGVYAYAVLDGGAISRIVVMGAAQVMAHRDKAMTTAIWDGPFGVSMWLKTGCHELEKWVPTSTSYRGQRARADAALAQMTPQASQGDAGGSESVRAQAHVGEPVGGPTDDQGAPES